MNFRSFIIFFLSASLSFSCLAQSGWEAGGWIGTSYYFGDLKTIPNLDKPGIAGGVKGRYLFNNRISLAFSANYARVNADDANSSNPFENRRNLHFRSGIIDGTAQVEFNFMPFEHGSYNNYFTPYLGVGLSAFRFNPKAELDGEWIALAPIGTEGQTGADVYSRVSGALAIAFGFKYNLSYYWSINVELSTRRAFTDYLDDVSTVYPNPSNLSPTASLLSDRSLPDADGLQIGQEGRQRGNSKDNDNYNLFGVSLVYWFGQVKCPAINRDIPSQW